MSANYVPPFTPDPQLFPFESRWWDADVPDADYSGRVHYIDEGEGPTILFLHGNPTWSFLFRGIIIRLRKQFRCVALDLPGFGLSEEHPGPALRPDAHADVVRAFVQALDLNDVIIFGHDWGGPIGLRVACDEVARLRGLVMANTFYWPLTSWKIKSFSYAMSTGAAQKAIQEKNMFVNKIMPQGMLHSVDDRVMHHYREAIPNPRRRRGAARLPRELMRASGWLADLSEDVAARLANVPLLLTWGVKDIAHPAEQMDQFREDFRMVRVSRLEGKHYVPEDCPAEIARAIQVWTDGLG